MSADVSIAIYKFCRLNGWNSGLISEIGRVNNIPDLHIRITLDDVDDVLVPDEYTIGPFYTGDYFAFEIFKEGKKLCTVYTEMPNSIA